LQSDIERETPLALPTPTTPPEQLHRRRQMSQMLTSNQVSAQTGIDKLVISNFKA
jgi:hypothetical protein